MERRFDRFEKDNRYLWHEVSSKIDTKIDVLTDKLVTHQIASLEKNGSAKAKAARDSMKVTVLWIVVGGAIMTALQLATSFISKLF